jgi:hypothetical protein
LYSQVHFNLSDFHFQLISIVSLSSNLVSIPVSSFLSPQLCPFILFYNIIYVICVCLCIVVFNAYCVVFFFRLVYLMLPVSPDCPFLAHLAKGNVSFCHHLASVVRRLSSVIFSHFNLLLWNPSAKGSETW